MKKMIATSFVLATMTTCLQSIYADTDKTAQASDNTQQQAQSQRTWLGVTLSSVPEVLSRQLGGRYP